MFTGLIEEIGTVRKITGGKNLNLRIACSFSPLVKTGDSIAVHGVCLTVTEKGQDWLSFDVMPATAEDTVIPKLRQGEKVHLERAIRADSRLDGHIVSGHIHCRGRVRKIRRTAGAQLLTVAFPAEHVGKAVLKGSIALNGVSLTIQCMERDCLTVSLIPETMERTCLGGLKPGQELNVEFDMPLNKGIESGKSGLPKSVKSGLTEADLRKMGY